VWPKGFSHNQRALFPHRQNRTCNVFYISPSWYTTNHGADIGNGLYTSVNIKANIRLMNFMGAVVPLADYNQRVAAGRGGYAIHLNAATVLDCFDFRRECSASMANSPVGLHTLQPGLPAHPHSNCRIIVANTAQGTVYLETTQNICRQTELFWNYGTHYIYPI
jgi:hypothetical protein